MKQLPQEILQNIQRALVLNKTSLKSKTLVLLSQIFVKEKTPTFVRAKVNLSRKAKSFSRWEYLVSVQPLKIDKGTGSPVNAIAFF
jgi:hypothetical protein